VERHDRHAQSLAIALAVLAGYVDAIGVLKLGGYFVSFMSGNTTRLAIGAVRYGAMAQTCAIVIAAFVAGVALGSLVAEATGPRRKSAILVLAGGMLFAAAFPGLGNHARLEHLIGLLALPAAMGVTNATFQRDGEISIGVTYMTGTLVRIGQHIAAALRGRDRFGWLPYLLLWLGLLIGGIIGAALYPIVGKHGLWLGAAAYFVLAAVAPKAVPTDGPGRAR